MKFSIITSVALSVFTLELPASAVEFFTDIVDTPGSVDFATSADLDGILPLSTITDGGFFNDPESYHVTLYGATITNPSNQDKLTFDMWLTRGGVEISNTRKSLFKIIADIGIGPAPANFDVAFPVEFLSPGQSVTFDDIHATVALRTNVFPDTTVQWSSFRLGVGAQRGEQVPGPLPILGVAAAFGFSRKLRKRIKLQKGTSDISTSAVT